MTLKINKAALSLSTAFLMVSSIASAAVTSAEETNEILLTADKTDVEADDRINLTLDYSPDDDGAAGFTVVLHYDSSKVDVYVPTDDELEDEFDTDSKFSVITNYTATDDTVKIVGANLTGSNVTSDTPIAMVAFDVKDGAQGDIDYWVEVETLVTATYDGYQSAVCSAPSESAPYVVEAQAEETTTVTTTSAESEKASTTSKSSTTTTTTTTTTTAQTSAVEATTAPVTTTAEQTSQTSQTTAQPQEASTEPLFSYAQGDEDFQSEEALQYGFRLSDYISDYSQNYDVRVNFETTGNVSGAVGMMVDGVWSSQGSSSVGVTQDTWVYENLNPAQSSDLVYMQIYYLKANSEINIMSVDVVPTGAAVQTQTVTSVTAGEPEETSIQTQEVTQTDVTSKTSETTQTTTSVESVQSAEILTEAIETEKAQQSLDQSDETESTTTTATTTTTAAAAEDEEQAESETVTTTAAYDSDSVSTQSTTAQDIIDAVDSAASEAKSSQASNENPSTGARVGKGVMNILTAAAAVEILFSLFVVIYNAIRAGKDSEEE